MYAIVRAGGRQEKVAVGDTLLIDRVSGDVGASVSFTPVLTVDGNKVTSDATVLAKIAVTGEIVETDVKGLKITIMKFKNKTGYRKRQGFRSKQTRVKITNIA